MNSQVKEIKDQIDEALGNAVGVKEVCEIYAELLHHIKRQMEFVIDTLLED
ncbi:MAG: hypothetical protein ACLRVU_09640 [Beduini sp.]|uniref:hypothetical protein n=1 Tax=Beduini sp. TaxID=1922300 RepID=UPI0039A1ECD5